LIAILAGCDSSSSPTTPAPSGPAPSASLANGQTVEKAFRAGDTTRLTLTTDSGRTWALSLTSDGLQVSARIVATGDQPPQHHFQYRAGLDDSLVFPCDRSGTFTLEITSSATGKTGTFKLLASAADTFPRDFQPRDGYEADGGAPKAKIIASDSSVQTRTLHGFEGWANDIDAIAFQGDSGKTYTLRYRSAVAGASVIAYLPDSSYWPEITTTKSKVGGEEIVTLEVPVEKTARYHFGVKNGNHVLRYQVALTAKAGLPERMIADRYENDDAMSRATPIAADSSIQRHTVHDNMYSPKDVDWISFHADSGWTYNMYSSYIDDAGYYGSFYSADSVLIHTGSNRMGAIQRQLFHARKSGTFYLKFQSYQRRNVYEVALTREQGIPAYALADTYEDDDSNAGAKTIAADSSWQDRTLHGWSQIDHSDSDYVSFQATAGTLYRLYMQDSTGFLRATAYEGGTTKLATTRGSTGTSYLYRTEFTPTTSGPCIIRIGTDFVPTPYRIALVAVKP